MNIITISREFGSGGREIGKRLADILGYDYYDKEILSSIAEEQEEKEEYSGHTSEIFAWQGVPITFRRSFAAPMVMNHPQTGVILQQKRIIEEIAKLGKNFIIVGRNADVILQEYNPFSIFVCADVDSKLRRCEERAAEGEDLTRKQMEYNMRKIDKNRAITRELVSDSKWGAVSSYKLTVNTTTWDIKKLSVALADFITKYFGE